MEQTFDREFVVKRVADFGNDYGVHQLGVSVEYGPVECFICNNGDFEIHEINDQMIDTFAPEDIAWSLPPFILTETFGNYGECFIREKSNE